MSRVKFKQILKEHPVLFQSTRFTTELKTRLQFDDPFDHIRFEYIEAETAHVLNMFNCSKKYRTNSDVQMFYKPTSKQVVVNIHGQRLDEQTSFSLNYKGNNLEKALKSIFALWHHVDAIDALQTDIAEELHNLHSLFIYS